MKALIDGNIILDVLQKRDPHFDASSKIWKLCETEQIEGFVSALTFANLVYVMRKELTPERINEVLKKLTLIFHFTELAVSDLTEAAELKWNDFEDAVQAAAASRIDADCIVTRNVRDYIQSRIPAFTPAELLKKNIAEESK